jgi:CHAD domain-containing protein
MNMNEEKEIFAPKSAKSPELIADMSCREAALRSIDFYFQNFLWNEKGTRIAKDPEFLHYFRVASKRLRVALSVFEKYFPEEDITRYRNALKSFSLILGKARDTDVYLEFLNDKISKTMSLKELMVFNKYKNFFLRRKKFRQKTVLNKLDSPDYKKFIEDFMDFISRASVSDNGIKQPPVTEIIERSIMVKLEKLFARSKKLNPKSSDSKLHKFRIKCRKLRYQVEIFLEITGSSGEELDRMLIELQRSLGAHHDAVTAGKKLNSFIRTHKEYSKSKVLRKIRKLQNERALKFRRKFFIQMNSQTEFS